VRRISAFFAPAMITIMLLSGAGSTEGVQAPQASGQTQVVELSADNHALAAKKRKKRKAQRLIAAPVEKLTEEQRINRDLAHKAVLERWDEEQWHCLELLWGPLIDGGMLESGWSHWARGGIPQARPPGKMAAQGADWQTSADTQIRWGLFHYIAVDKKFQKGGSSPCAALNFRLKHRYY
jgi:hypothetical protein